VPSLTAVERFDDQWPLDRLACEPALSVAGNHAKLCRRTVTGEEQIIAATAGEQEQEPAPGQGPDRESEVARRSMAPK
jgi:hypothetical protein